MDKIFAMAFIAASFAACKSTNTESAANKALLRRFYEEVYVHWNMAMADEVLLPGFISHDWPEGTPGGPQAFRAYYAAIRKLAIVWLLPQMAAGFQLKDYTKLRSDN